MPNKFKINSLIVSVLAFSFLLLPTTSFAQVEIAHTFDISDANAKDGDILIFSQADGIKRTDKTYDDRLFGVLQDKPAIVIRSKTGNQKPILRSGIANVNVNLSNGPIKKGDYITSSAILGEGMKANIPANVIGIALEDFTQQNSSIQIKVAMKVEYADLSSSASKNQIINYIRTVLLKDTQDPTASNRFMKFVLAGILILGTLTFAIFSSGRSIPKAVEAIGRNPLARRDIYLSLFVNLLMSLAIFAAGLTASVIILSL